MKTKTLKPKTLSTNILKESCYYLLDGFKDKILGDIKKVPLIPLKGTMVTLTKTTTDQEIIEQTGYMTREELISTLIQLTQKQKNGEAGELLTNGYTSIIGYVKLEDGSVLDGRCSWNSVGQEWLCSSFDLGEWYADRSFWSRNGVHKALGDDPLALENLDALKRVKLLQKKYKKLITLVEQMQEVLANEIPDMKGHILKD